jgi:ABC-type amino acid transport substrate-binding protein
MLKILRALGAACVAAVALAACASQAASPGAAAATDDAEVAGTEVGAVRPPDGALPVLRVGSDLDNRPFAWVDERGRPQGRDVEMMTAIAHLLHRRIEWERLPFDKLLPAVQAGEVDVVCATLGVTPERQDLVDFTRPYFETSIAVVVRRGEGEPDSLEALAGKRVSAGTGTTSERAVLRSLPAATGVFENKAGLPTAERLLSREVDAAVMDSPAADALVAASGGRLRRLPDALGEERYALALPRGRDALREQLDHALGVFERAGSQQRWNEKHGLAPAE